MKNAISLKLSTGCKNHDKIPVSVSCPKEGWAVLTIGGLKVQFSYVVPFAKPFLEKSLEYLKKGKPFELVLDGEFHDGSAFVKFTPTKTTIEIFHGELWSRVADSVDDIGYSNTELRYAVELDLKYVIEQIYRNISSDYMEWAIFDEGLPIDLLDLKYDSKWETETRCKYYALLDDISELLREE